MEAQARVGSAPRKLQPLPYKRRTWVASPRARRPADIVIHSGPGLDATRGDSNEVTELLRQPHLLLAGAARKNSLVRDPRMGASWLEVNHRLVDVADADQR